VKPQEVERRNNSTVLKREFISDKPMKPRRRLSFAGTSRCMEPAGMVTHAHMPTDPTNSKKRPIFQATS